MLCGHGDVISCLAVSRGNLHLVSGSGDRTVRLWKFADIISSDVSYIFSPDRPAKGGYRKRELEPDILRGHKKGVACVCFSKHGILCTAGLDKWVFLWNVVKCTRLHKLNCESSGWMRSVNFSRDGCVLGCATDGDRILLFDVASGKLVKRLETDLDTPLDCSFGYNTVVYVTGAKHSLIFIQN